MPTVIATYTLEMEFAPKRVLDDEDICILIARGRISKKTDKILKRIESLRRLYQIWKLLLNLGKKEGRNHE